MAYSHGQYTYNPVPRPEQQQFQAYNSNDQIPFSPKVPIDGLEPAISSPSNPLAVAQEAASRKRVVRTTVLIAICILLSTIGMIFAFLSFICVFHQCHTSRTAIVSTAPLGLVLTISQVTSHVAPLSVPIIMGLVSYLLSAMWLRSSIDGGPNRPSPMQLGLLMSMCNGAGLSSLFSSIKYTLKPASQKGLQTHEIAHPPILRQSIFWLGSLLAVTYLAAAADSWLHASSASVNIPFTSPYSWTIAVPNFGREINSTMCSLAQGDGSFAANIEQKSCGLINSGSGGSGYTLAEGVRVVSNTSSLHSVVFADDQTALVVPISQNLPANISYTARTLGVKSQCVTITRECIQPSSFDGSLDYGPNSQLNLNCSNAGIKYVNGTGQSTLCALDNQGLCTFGEQIQTNPFTTGDIVTSSAYLGPTADSDTFIPNTGWFVHGNNGAWNVVFCSITALDVLYKYESQRYIMLSSTPQPLTTARYIASAMFDTAGTTFVSSAVEGAGLLPNTTYEETYSLELSRQTLARAAHIYEPAIVLDIQSEHTVTGSKLQLVPLVLFIVGLLIFLFQVLYIALRTIVATWGVQYVGLAARHLSDPIAAVQRLYGHLDPALTWEMDSEKGFGAEIDQNRLRVGPVMLADSGAPYSVFMVSKT